MSAIKARISAFESLSQDAPQRPAGRKAPIKLFETETDDTLNTMPVNNAASAPALNREKEADDEAHELSVGSITSDFVKVSPPRSKAPPLPPRRGSENTFSSSSSTPSTEGVISNGSSSNSSVPRGPPTPRPIPQKVKAFGGGMAVANGPPSSLTVTPRNSKGHMPAPSASSFHSVSLSDHGDSEAEHGLGGSYEAVSPHSGSVFSLVDRSNSITSSPATSISNLAPPALPPRPGSMSPNPPVAIKSNTSDAMAHQINVPYAVRKVPPPSPRYSTGALNKGHRPTPLEDIPPRPSARSSIVSLSTTIASPSSTQFFPSNGKSLSRTSTATIHPGVNTQSISKKRPPPLPPVARARYDAVFDANMNAQKERNVAAADRSRPGSISRRAVGWRGTSVDLTTQPLEMGDVAARDSLGANEDVRLSGQVVKLIWECSKLPRSTLKAIWNECDPDRKGSLDKQSFANGMWRIDNELLSAASARDRTPSSSTFRFHRVSDIRP